MKHHCNIPKLASFLGDICPASLYNLLLSSNDGIV